jgi:trimeric autotransporter adhesin
VTGLADTISSWGSNSTLAGSGSSSSTGFIYSAGDSAFVEGGAGRDSIVLSGANDTFAAGSGNTKIYVNDASDVINAGAGSGVDTIFASVSYTAPTNVNVLTLTGTANIAATGNAGSDVLTAGAGDDTLIAGSGPATLIGGTGNTTFVINSSSDVIQESSTTTNNQVVSSVGYTLPNAINTLTLTGTANLVGRANGGNDTLVSNSGVDTLYGGSGNDTFVVNNPGDVIVFGSGTVTIVDGFQPGYSLPSGALTLMLSGTANLVGRADGGNDTLISNSGVDTLYGGSGNDTFVINNSADVVVDTVTTTSNAIQSSVSFTLPTNVNTLVLTGTAALVGTGNSAADVISANSGNDTLIAGTGLATLTGGARNDVFVVNNTGDVVRGAPTGVSDTLYSSVSYTLAANVDTLVLTGTASIAGAANSDNDTLISNSGVDTLIGGSGNETYVVNNSGDVIQDHSALHGSVVESSVSYTLAASAISLELVGAGNLAAAALGSSDSMVAGAGQDTLVAASSFDTLVAGSGATTLVGQSIYDVFVVNSSSDVVTVVGGSPSTDVIDSSVSYTVSGGIGTLVLTGSANLSGTAVSGNNSIVGNSGQDVLYAGTGADTLVAGSAPTTLVGGTGSDTFVVNSTADVLLNISSVAGNHLVSSISYTLPTQVSILTFTGNAALVGVGNSGNNTLVGNDGNDTLIAGSGVADLIGGEGADLFIINSTADIVSNPNYLTSSGVDTIQSSVGYTLPDHINVLVLTGTASLVAAGNNQADSIVGNAGADTLQAGVGNDTLVAGSGLATLIGALGNDTFVINNTGDVIRDSVAGGSNTLVSSVSYTLPTNITAFVLAGTAALVAVGNAANDSIKGNAGADTLIAGAGNDTLVAGSGLATLVGGAGNDTFIVNNSADVVLDTSTGSTNSVFSSSSYVLPTNVSVLTLTGAGDLMATGNTANHTLIGGAGNDTLVAGTGAGTLIGGAGNTTFVVDSQSDAVIDTYAAASNILQSSVSYTLATNVNTLVLTGTGNLSGTANSAQDTLVSNTGVDTLFGGSGTDSFVINNTADVVVVSSATNNDTVYSSVSYALPGNLRYLMLTGSQNLVGTAGGANDTLVANSGIDTLVGGAGDTFVIGNAADVVVDTAASTSSLIESAFSYSLPTNVNNLTLTGTAALLATGNSASDVILGNAGSDTLVAGAGPATLVGSSGHDVFVVNSTNDVVVESVAGTGSTIQSSVSYSLPTNVAMLILTGTGNLVATANSGNDTLVSNSGVDTLIAGGANTVVIINNPLDVVENLPNGAAIGAASNYTLAGSGALTLIGTADLMATGGNGSDTLTAGQGNDTLVAGSGLATLIGGSGNDTFVVDNTGDVVVDTYSTTANTLSSSVSYSLPGNVDILTLTGTANLVGHGNSDLQNQLSAISGNDLLVATATSNTLYGGAGSDTLDAGWFTNLIYAGNGGTAAAPTYVHGDASGTSIATQTTVYGGSGTDVLYGGPGFDSILSGTGTSTMVGGSGNETLDGSAGQNTILGGSGTNLIYGGAGTALIEQGSGTNVIYGGSGGTAAAPQLISYQNGVSNATQSTIFGGSGYYTIHAGPGQDVIYGGSGTGTLYADSGVDTIYGGSGVQTIIGDGRSLLVGGSGDQVIEGTGLDTVVAGTGNSTLSGGSNGTLEFNQGFGNATVAFEGPTVGNIVFGPGVQPSDLTLNVQEINSQMWLTISDGTSTLDIQDGYSPGVLGSISFADSGTQTLTQLMQMDGPHSTLTFDDIGLMISAGNNQSIANDPNIRSIFAFGNADSIAAQNAGYILAAGDNNTIQASAGNSLVVQGNGNLILDTDSEATLTGSNDTLVGDANFIYLYQSSDVIVDPNPVYDNIIEAYASFVMPTGTRDMRMDGPSLVGSSNNQGGVLTANGNFDTLIGGAGVDTLDAAGHNQVLVGGSGTETYILSQSDDRVVVGTGNSTIETFFSYTLPTGINSLEVFGDSLLAVGNSGNDLITSAYGGDTLVAGAGNDTLVAAYYYGSGSTLIGGSGNDTFVVHSSADVIIETWATTSNTIVASTSYTLPTNVNILDLNTQNGRGQGNSANDLITDVGYYGNNTLVAGSGNDTLVVDFQPYGSSGDVLVAGTGQDLMTDVAAGRQQTFLFNQGFSQDTVIGGMTNDVIEFGAGITASGLTFTAVPASAGAAPSLVISGYGGAITVAGGLAPGMIGSIEFSDGSSYSVQQLVAPSGVVTVAGASGNLILSTGNGASITTGSGLDTVFAWGNNDTVTAGTGNAVINAEGSSDQITGGTGADTLAAYGANDTLTSGSGPTTFVVEDSSTTVNVAAGNGQTTVVSSVSYTLPDNVATLIMTGTAPITAYGNSLNDLIIGNAKGDTFVGGDGVDTFVGYAALDSIDGGGADVFEVDNTGDVVEVSGNSTGEEIMSTVSYTVPANVSALLLEGDDLVATGGAQGALLRTYYGSYDTLVSGSGADTFYSGNYNTLIVNNSADVFEYLGAVDTIISGVSATVDEIDQHIAEPYYQYSDWILTGTANLVADDVTNGDLWITGNAGNDTLIGADNGYDYLQAGTGVDTLIGGGSGSITTFVINNAADVIITEPGSVGNIVDSYINYTLPANLSQVNLEASGLLAQGNSVDGSILSAYNFDTLIAGSGRETLESQAYGHSTLVAGSGSDYLMGSIGDVLLFNAGFGQAEVNSTFTNSTSSGRTIEFGSGIPAADLTVTAAIDSNAEPALVVAYNDGAGDSGAVTLDGALAFQSDQYEFAGGSPLTLAQFLAQVHVTDSTVAGSSGNLVLEGSSNQSVSGGTGDDTIYAVGMGDTLVGGSAGSQQLEAVGAGDVLVGGGGSDTLTGLGANDTLMAGSAIVTMVGGTGAAVEFVVNNSGDKIQVQASPGADSISSSVSYTLPANVTTLILTAAGLKGSANSTGADTLISSTVGVDTLAGGNGNDYFILNVSGDVVTDSSASAHNTVQAGFSYSLSTDVNTLILTGTGALTGIGNSAADLLVGNTGADTLTAVGTNATTLMGGGGNETFVVVNSKDVVVETFTGTSDLILSSANYTLPTNVNVLTLTGTAALAATGNGANDILNANSGADTLFAGAGVATLNGGSGNDIFVVNNTNDVVVVTATGVTDTIESTVNYVLPANVLKLTLEGTAALSATGNSLNDTLTANSGADTLIAGSGTDSLVGGAGADLFIINSTADVVSVGATHGNDTIQSSVNVTAPANVANITLTGTSNLTATGSTTLAGVLTANDGNDTLTAMDTVAGSAVTLRGGAGNDVFVINSTADVIVDTYTSTTNTLNTSVSYTLPTNVNILNATGTAALIEHGNSGNDSITANTGADTLVAGNGSDTLVSGTGIDSLVGGTGTDVFVVKNASDIVTVATTGTNDTISSSVSFTLPTNVQYLTLTGTGTVTGTGNGITDLIVANTGTDTLTGGTGIAVLEGGTGTSAHDTLKAPSAQAALIAGGGASTLTGGAFKDFYAAGAVSDTITTGATANVIAVNKGDGATTIAPTTGASNVLSLGAGIDTENLTFTKSGTTNLILSDSVTGDSITLTNWYTSTNNQNIKTLQVIEQASANYNSSGTDALRNKPLEEFNFSALFAAFTSAGSTAGWSLSNGMPAAALTSSATSAYGGDLAYYFGLNGNLTGMTLSAAQAALTNTSFGTAPQTIDSWSSISGGGGLHLMAEESAGYVDPVQMQWLSADTAIDPKSGLAGSEVELATDHEDTGLILASALSAQTARRNNNIPHIRDVRA